MGFIFLLKYSNKRMSEFKKNLKNAKISYKKCRKLKKEKIEETLFRVVGVIVFITALIVLVILLFSKSKYYDVKGQDSIDMKNKTTDSLTYLKGNSVNGVENSTKYLAEFKNIIRSLFSKLYINTDSKFIEELNELTYETHVDAMDRIKDIKKLFEGMINFYKPYETSQQLNITIYYKALMYLFEILYKSYGSFETDGLECIYISETPDQVDHPEGNYDTCRFIFQQYHLNIVIETVLMTTHKFNKVISSLIKENENNGIFRDIATLIAFDLNQSKDDIFQYFNRGTDLIHNGVNLHLRFIMTSFKDYRKFLILNFYLIYMQIFEINSEYKVINFNSHFLKVFPEDHENKYYIDECIDLFKNIGIKQEGIENIFYDSFDKLNKKCKELIYDLARKMTLNLTI